MEADLRLIILHGTDHWPVIPIKRGIFVAVPEFRYIEEKAFRMYSCPKLFEKTTCASGDWQAPGNSMWALWWILQCHMVPFTTYSSVLSQWMIRCLFWMLFMDTLTDLRLLAEIQGMQE